MQKYREPMQKLLVVSAWEPELARFRELSRQDLDWVATISMAAVGIGVVDAAIGMTSLLAASTSTDHVLFLGTCGAMPGSALSVGDVVVGSRLALVDSAVLDGKAKTPFSTAFEVAADPELRRALVEAGARPSSIATTFGVTIDDALARTVAASGDVEHLEAYGVARACVGANVPCAIVLGVANAVGASGSDDWRRNHEAVSARVAEIAWEAIRAYVRTSTRARSTGRA